MKNNEKSIFTLYITAFLLFEMLCYLANAMIMPSMVQVVHAFYVSKSAISSMVIIYMIGVSLTPLFVAPLADKVGKSRVILLGCFVFAISNMVCPLSHSYFMFIFWRFMQGTGQGVIFLGYTMIHESFDDIAAVKLTAMMANVTVLAPIIGPAIGSVIAISLGWKFIFWLTGVLAGIAFLGLYVWKPLDLSKNHQSNLKTQLANYKAILFNKKFILAVIILTLAMVPSELWMVFSVIIVLTTLKLSLFTYNVYMVVIVLAFILSSFVLRQLVQCMTFSQLIRIGATIFALGAFATLFCMHSSLYFVVCLAISVFGGGLFRGIVYRKLMTDVHGNKNAVSAVFNLVLTVALILVIFLGNTLFKFENYSLLSFALYTGLTSFLCLLFAILFIAEPQRKKEMYNSPLTYEV